MKCNFNKRKLSSWGQILNYYIDPYASCSKDAEIIVGKNPLYCKDHGCSQCFYEEMHNNYRKVKEGDYRCKKHYEGYLGFKKLFEIEEQVKKIKVLDSQLENELRGISNDFFNLIKEPVNLVNQAKEKLIRQEISSLVFRAVAGGLIIDGYSSFADDKNQKWKKIYDPIKKMEVICKDEKDFLVHLAKDYKSKSDAEKTRLAEEARQKAETEKRKREEAEKKRLAEEEKEKAKYQKQVNSETKKDKEDGNSPNQSPNKTTPPSQKSSPPPPSSLDKPKDNSEEPKPNGSETPPETCQKCKQKCGGLQKKSIGGKIIWVCKECEEKFNRPQQNYPPLTPQKEKGNVIYVVVLVAVVLVGMVYFGKKKKKQRKL